MTSARARRASRGGFSRAQGGQAMPITLFLALATVVAGCSSRSLGAAATGASRYQRAADLAAVSAARSMRDDHHRLFLPATLAERGAEPGAPERRRVPAARDRRGASRRPSETAQARSRRSVTFPGATFAPTRVRVELAARPRRRRRARPRPRSSVNAVAEAYPAAAASPPSAPTVAAGGGYSGPLATRQGEGMRPDVAQGVRRDGRRRGARAGHALLDQLGVSLRRRAGGALRGQPRPAHGRPAGHVASPLRDRARPRSRRPPTAGSPPTRSGSASSSATPGRRGTTATRAGRRRARTRATASRAGAAAAETARARNGAALLRPGAVPRADRARGLALERARQRPRGAAPRRVELQPARRLAGGRQRDRPVHARDRRRLRASTIRSTPTRRSTRRRT